MHISKNFTWLKYRRWCSKLTLSRGIMSDRHNNVWSVMIYDFSKPISIWKHQRDDSSRYGS